MNTDEGAIDRLVARVREEGFADRFHVVVGDLASVDLRGDVVLFEFSLHTIWDAPSAIARAGMLAPEIVVMDHAPGSPWSWFTSEDQGVVDGWAAVRRTAIVRQTSVDAVQRFSDYTALQIRMRHHGSTSQARIEEFASIAPIEIAMPYRLALLAGACVHPLRAPQNFRIGS